MTDDQKKKLEQKLWDIANISITRWRRLTRG